MLQVNLWGLDAIKTKGESVAVALHLVGARPVREGTGRIARCVMRSPLVGFRALVFMRLPTRCAFATLQKDPWCRQDGACLDPPD